MKLLRYCKKHWKVALAVLVIAGAAFWRMLPKPLFETPYSSVLLDRNGQLLQAHIASDGQWRFPQNPEVPDKFAQCIIAFEDKRFAYHPGVDIAALGRSAWYDVKNRSIVSGGSTLTMQVARLSRNRSRNLWQKLVEIMLALRIECSYSKKEILALYAAHAPFGGNVVGLEAASWRYFGRDASQLSWGESASLAVLPNNPAMVRPDRNRGRLRRKRDELLHTLYNRGIIDQTTMQLALLEPIPDKPLVLPEQAPHLLGSLMNGKLTQQHTAEPLIRSTLDARIQDKVSRILCRHHQQLTANGINNGAALVMSVESGEVLAYAGNVYRPDQPDFDSYVDVIPSPRSPGSTLKPLLYAAMLQDGLILPKTLIADIPTRVAAYSPRNFDLAYDGAVPADKALARSLNVPAVRLLQQYRTERFYQLLKQTGVTTLNHPSSHYGLSLILGGGESSMWELAGVYASMARIVNHYGAYSSRYNPADLHMPVVLQNSKKNTVPSPADLSSHFMLGAGALYCTFDAMKEVMRPGEEGLWSQFGSAQRIAWKTGTSFGFRDGWAIGFTPRYLVAVWIGNADGEGRPGLTGIGTAAPVLFDIFRSLPQSPWFEVPYDDLCYVNTCHQSGYLATGVCNSGDSLLVPLSGQHSAPCPFHQLVHLDASGRYRVSSDCESPASMRHEAWFVLPPAMEWYYKNHDPAYRTLPPWRAGCTPQAAGMMEMIYPRRSGGIWIPVELDGKTGRCVFEVAHRNKEVQIYWHMDGEYLGTTRDFHQMALAPPAGRHILVLVDEHGERIEQYFEVLQH